MRSKRIALAGYPAVYFLHFARSLEEVGFDVHWICALTAEAQYLRTSGVPSDHILDVNLDFDRHGSQAEGARERLRRLESADQPTVNDIILMDRILSRKSPDFSIRYMDHLGCSISAFLEGRRIAMISSWRDTALQLMTMLVCKKRGIGFVIPTRARIPQEMYGFCTSHHTADFVKLRDVEDADRKWAADFLHEFENRGVRPALKIAARGLSDVMRMLPVHARTFTYELRRSLRDAGNDYARYPITRLVAMYLRRKANLLAYKLVRPSQASLADDEPFCLYALHTQPESSIDVVGSFFSDQVGLIRNIARSLPATHMLYVKVHPTDVDGKTLAFYRAIKSIPSVKLIDFSVDSRRLLERASLLFALTGTIAYEAGLLGKPVIVFAKNFFNDLPTIHYCDSPPALPALIERLLVSGVPDQTTLRPRTLAFLARLRASCHDGEVSRSHISHRTYLTPTDLQTTQCAYLSLFSRFAAESE
jgi:hypothetical protein